MPRRALPVTVAAATALLLILPLGGPALAAELGSPAEESAGATPAGEPAATAGPAETATETAEPTEPAASTAPPAPSDDTVLDTYAVRPGDVESIDLDSDEVTMVGARWSGEDPDLEIRYLENGSWSAWEELPPADDGPDADSAEGRAAGGQSMSEAVPVLDSSQVEVRSAAGASTTSGLEITTVTTPVTAADEAVAETPTPSPATGLSPQQYNAGLKANIVTRQEWGADESLVRCSSDSTPSAQGVFLHHTAGSNSYTREQAPAIIRGYLTYHTQSRGWCDIGYNFLVDRFGTVYEGRAGSIDKAITGAHAAGFNTSTIGVAVLGTYTSAAPSSEAQKAVERIIAWKANTYGFSPTGSMTLTSGGGSTSKYPAGRAVTLKTVSGHRDTSYTDCPGTAFYNRLGAIRTAAQDLQASLGYETKGAIGAYYRANRAQTGEPLSNEKPLSNPAGAYQYFQKGVVYWSSATGAHLNKGGIRTAYRATGYEKGRLGFPTSDEITFKYRSNAVYQKYQNGIITYSSTTKGQPLAFGMLSKWKELGWERSRLGLPTSGEFPSAGKTRQNFESGYMTYKAGEGVRVYLGG